MKLLLPFFSPILYKSNENFRKNVYHANLEIPLAHNFTTRLKNLLGKKNLFPEHTFTPSAIQALLRKETLFDIPNIEQLCNFEINPLAFYRYSPNLPFSISVFSDSHFKYTNLRTISKILSNSLKLF